MDKVGLSDKYKTYPEYKNINLGWLSQIPIHWDVKKLKYLGESIIGLTYAPENVVGEGDGILVLRSSNIQNKKLEFEDNVYVNKKIPGKLITREGDILICARNGSRALIGKNAQITKDVAGVSFGAFMSIFRSPYNNYLSNVFNSPLFEYQSGSFLTATINQLTTGNLNSFEIPLPTELEREKIANFLDHETAKIDTLIDKQQQLIKLLKEKRQAVISHAVTKGLNSNVPMRDSGVEWLGEVPEHWDFVPIKHIVEIPVTDGPHETPNFIDEGVPFISAEAVSAGKIDFKKIRAHISEEDNERYSLKYSPKIHDIYMVKSGATTGVTAIVETHVNFNIWSPLAVIRCKEDSSPYFVLNFMRSINFQEAVELNWSFGTQQNIGMGVIENLIVTKPPLVEAIEIVENLKIKCSLYDSVIGKALNQIDLMKERRTALISAAVTGKIDVREWIDLDVSVGKEEV
ncbi:restriction endonuclease subunit S [Thalassolituus oleivorans]|uniref:Restriction enzyme, Res subunit n=1 Tax=Thalassolituus oleivorans MIL-1 TaxID=1298593 RepID=M5E6Q9_9GAMM|nr:restriction endonuclease subunit S [Thalassolituus oleivorans]CCU73150.1 restriction enzyme, Res subunit [Thalassolituus oleivorans MIL-1]